MTAESSRPVTRALALAIVVLLGHGVWQQYRYRALAEEMGYQQRHFEEQVGERAVQQMHALRQDIIATAQWLHQYYASDQGLRRATGLWLPQQQQPDFEALGAWVFDVYLAARVHGKTDAEARKMVEDAIRQSEEWRRAHAQG
jgi:hypothetical protein